MQTTQRRVPTFVVGCLIVVGTAAAIAAQNNPAVGTWKLNPAKSKYSPGPAPKSVTLKIEAAAGGTTTTTVDGVGPEGATQHWTYTAAYDGKDASVTGNPNADTAARKRVNATTTETTFKKGGKVTTVNTLVVSADGKTLTITAKGTDPQGRAVSNVQVYERQ